MTEMTERTAVDETIAEELARLKKRLTLLEDRDEIRELKNRYARFCDDGWDAEGIASLFVPDGEWLVRSAGGGVVGLHHSADAIRGHFETRPALIPWTLHYMSNPVIDVAEDGQTATGTWIMHSYSTVTDGEEPETAILLICTYKNDFVKVDGRWKFRRLTCMVHSRSPFGVGWVKHRWL
jgi:hypothetical protein